ncbi:MAG TPA: glycosyltransferase family 4 protein [Candidatus Limnocylindrales bacterium]|nr:glycosyltransferase family 4 protein [Candidatus Limnocylindrales bacterium]
MHEDPVTARPPSGSEPLRIALLAPPMVPVPPPGYAGTERIVAILAEELHRRGHRVTLFASGDSEPPCELVPTVDRALWATGYRGDVSAHIDLTLAKAWERHRDFDVIHSHVETGGFLFARQCPTPVVTTLHGRLDVAGIPDLIDEFSDIALVAISASQRRWWPDANWVATIHHGLPLERVPFGRRAGRDLVLVGRIAREKGIQEAIELARRTGRRLRLAAKVHDPDEQELFDALVKPAITDGLVDWKGELPPAQRDPLLASSLATLMLGAWPEPFGLVAIESLATGTPVIARHAGALPEIIEHGTDGFLVDDLDEAELAVRLVPKLDRERIRARALERFSVERMVDEYEAVYRRLAETGSGDGESRVASLPVGRWPVVVPVEPQSGIGSAVPAAPVTGRPGAGRSSVRLGSQRVVAPQEVAR